MEEHESLYEPQFRKKMFSVKPEQPALFFTSQWSSSRTFYCVYRGFVTLYGLAWLFYSWIDVLDEEYSALYLSYLTNLGEIWFNIYMLYAFVVALVGKFHETADLDEMTTSTGILWTLQITSYYIILYICIFYWALLSGGTVTNAATNIHKHTIVGVLVLIDLFVVANKVHYLHAVYGIIPGFLYVLLSLILHWTGVNSAIYPVTDWANDPLLAGLLSAGSTLLVPLILQAVIFGLYMLRRFIYFRTKRRTSVPRKDLEVGVYYVNYDNHAFDD